MSNIDLNEDTPNIEGVIFWNHKTQAWCAPFSRLDGTGDTLWVAIDYHPWTGELLKAPSFKDPIDPLDEGDNLGESPDY